MKTYKQCYDDLLAMGFKTMQEGPRMGVFISKNEIAFVFWNGPDGEGFSYEIFTKKDNPENQKVYVEYLDGKNNYITTVKAVRLKLMDESEIWKSAFFENLLVNGFAYSRWAKYSLVKTKELTPEN